MKKILIAGLGSIGQRHLRNVHALLTMQEGAFYIDALRSSDRVLPKDITALVHAQYTDDGALPDDYDIAFICTPTANHYTDVKRLTAKARHLFIEKPVFDHDAYDVAALGLRPDGIYYVAAPLRYTGVLQYLKQFVQTSAVLAVRTICSTYLPDWRPGVDYRTTYSAHTAMGGGVSIDLIHEWDYLCYLFGLPERVENMRGQVSDLELDSDDVSLYIGRYPDKLVSLHLDYFGRFERREVELYTADDTVVGDIRHQKICFLRSGETIDLTEARDDYQKRELLHFFDMVNGAAENDNSVEDAVRTLKIVEGSFHAAACNITF